jgi:DNA invertase Pin-like site-specific DNA recombinase
MLIGYVRVGPVEQRSCAQDQERDLLAAGVTRLFKEESGSAGDRVVLEDAIQAAGSGDTLIVTSLDRLARSMTHLAEVLRHLELKRVSLRVLQIKLDTSKREWASILSLLEPIAKFERDIKSARQQEGIAKAKARGRYRGRSPTARGQWSSIVFLKDSGETAAHIAKRLDISVASVNRVLKAHREKIDRNGAGLRSGERRGHTGSP